MPSTRKAIEAAYEDARLKLIAPFTEQDRSDAQGVLQLLNGRALRAVIRGELNLNQIAREEFGNRGYDLDGRWVGFERSREIAATVFCVSHRGKRMRVTIPPREGK